MIEKGKIFMLFGPSGHGKSTLADIVLNHFKDGSFIINKKLSPRPPRNEKEVRGEASDAFVGVPYEEVITSDFVQSSFPYFDFSDEWINASHEERDEQLLSTSNGTNITPILEALERGQNVLWLTTDPSYFWHIKFSLGIKDVIPIMIWRGLDKETFEAQLAQRGSSEAEIKQRWVAQLKSMFSFLPTADNYINQYIVSSKNEQLDADKLLNWFCLIAKRYNAIPSSYPIGNANDEIAYYWTKEWFDTFVRVHMQKWQEFLADNGMPYNPRNPFTFDPGALETVIEAKKEGKIK